VVCIAHHQQVPPNDKAHPPGGSGVWQSPFLTVSGVEQLKSPPIARSGAAMVGRPS